VVAEWLVLLHLQCELGWRYYLAWLGLASKLVIMTSRDWLWWLNLRALVISNFSQVFVDFGFICFGFEVGWIVVLKNVGFLVYNSHTDTMPYNANMAYQQEVG